MFQLCEKLFAKLEPAATGGVIRSLRSLYAKRGAYVPPFFTLFPRLAGSLLRLGKSFSTTRKVVDLPKFCKDFLDLFVAMFYNRGE